MADDTVVSDVFIPPSVASQLDALYHGDSYSFFSALPVNITPNRLDNDASQGTPCVLGVDEAGRGPVIGPMVYGTFYLPIELQQTLLADTHHFDDSKVLTPAVRTDLMKKTCSPGTDLYENCGFAIKSLSAQDISAGMLKNGGSYNLNAQAMDATIEIIRGVIESGVNVREIYVDTIGQPAVYQKKLERVFPTVKITVEKKADSLYPCVSAASVVAKVTRDVSCEMLYEEFVRQENLRDGEHNGWGSGYPSDARCIAWMKANIDPLFGWGSECRFSWGTAKDMLEAKGETVKLTNWPADDDEENLKLSNYFTAGAATHNSEQDELRQWFGSSAGEEVF